MDSPSSTHTHTPTPFLVSPSFFNNTSRSTESPCYIPYDNIIQQLRSKRKHASAFKVSREISVTANTMCLNTNNLNRIKRSIRRRVISAALCSDKECRKNNPMLLKERNELGELRLRCNTCHTWSSAQFCTNASCEEEPYLKNADTGYMECPTCHTRGRRCDNRCHNDTRPMTPEERSSILKSGTTKHKCANKCPDATFVTDCDGVACQTCGLVVMCSGGLIVDDVESGAVSRQFEEDREYEQAKTAEHERDNSSKQSYKDTVKSLQHAKQTMTRDRVELWTADYTRHIREVWLKTSKPFNSPIAQSAAYLLAMHSHTLGNKTPHRLPGCTPLYAAALYIASTTCSSWRDTYTIPFLANEFIPMTGPSTTTTDRNRVAMMTQMNTLSQEVRGLYSVIQGSPHLQGAYGLPQRDLFWEIVSDLLNEFMNDPRIALTQPIRNRIDSDLQTAQKHTHIASNHKPITMAAALFAEGVGRSDIVVVPNSDTRKTITLDVVTDIVSVSKQSIKIVQKELFPERYEHNLPAPPPRKKQKNTTSS